MRNKILNYNFGNCLKCLYSLNNIDINKRGWAKLVTEDMFDKGILEYDSDNNVDSRSKQRTYIQRVLHDHIKKSSAENISGNWLTKYCTYFDCSADYLMGYIEKPTQADTDISKETGLTVEAIAALKLLKLDAEKDAIFQNIELDVLNFILESIHKKQKNGIGFTNSILHFMGLYFISDSIEKEPANQIRYRFNDTKWDALKIGDSINGNAVQEVDLLCDNTNLSINDNKLSVLNPQNNQHYALDIARLFKAQALNGIHEKIIKLEKEWNAQNGGEPEK